MCIPLKGNRAFADLCADPKRGLGTIHEYSDSLSQQTKGENGAHRMKQALKVAKPDIRAEVPALAECLHKRRGTADEPVIIMTSGGDRSVNGCSLVGVDDGTNNVWSFTALATKPNPKESAEYSWVWKVDGDITAGTAGGETGGGSQSITVRYPAGRHIPKLSVFRTATTDGKLTGEPTLIGTAEIHAISVYSSTADATAWLVDPVSSEDSAGSMGKLTRYPDFTGMAQVLVSAASMSSARSRMSADGYPQNEYWVTASDSADLPQPFVFQVGESKSVWAQGYEMPSSSTNDLSVRISASKSFDKNPTEAKFSTILLDAIVDVDRDHKWDYKKDRSGLTLPYHFWLNDDVDKVTTIADPIFGGSDDQVDAEPGTEISENSLIPITRDYDRTWIEVKRDLEDYAPMNIAVGSQIMPIAVTSSQLQVRWHPLNLIGKPEIKFFCNADPEGEVGYLTDLNGTSALQTKDPAIFQYEEDFAAPIGEATSTTWTPLGQLNELSKYQLIRQSRYNCPIIWEAGTAGSGWLEFRIVNRGVSGVDQVIGRDRLYLDLSPLSDWYTHVSTDPIDDIEFKDGRGTMPTELRFVSKQKSWVLDATEAETMVFIHGYNMVPWEKRSFAETAFKRMWWNGYQGRMLEFDWPTSFGRRAIVGDPINSMNGFCASEQAALHSGDKLAELLDVMRGDPKHYGKLNIVAHSHGNVVAANALRQISKGAVEAYVGMQAAVACEFYGNPASVMIPQRWLRGLAVQSNDPLVITPDYSGFMEPADWVLHKAEGLETPNLAQGYFAMDRDGESNAGSLGGAKTRVNIFNQNDWALGEYVWEWAGLLNPNQRMDMEGKPNVYYSYLREMEVVAGKELPVPSNLGVFTAPDDDSNKEWRIGYREFITSFGGNKFDLRPKTDVFNFTSLSWNAVEGNLHGQFGAIGFKQYQDIQAQGSSIGGDPEFDRNYFDAVSKDEQKSRQYEIISYVLEPRMRAQGRTALNPTIAANNANAFDYWDQFADDSQDLKPGHLPNGIEAGSGGRYSHHRWHSGEFNNTIMEQANFWKNVLGFFATNSKESLNVQPIEAKP